MAEMMLLLLFCLLLVSSALLQEQQEKIAQALLGQFNPQRKIRFRSSTNVEDSEQFVGAGLYDSYSGCLADERDTDATGPSACDAAEPKERGVFRADYEATTLRGHLGLPVPVNRHTAAREAVDEVV